MPGNNDAYHRTVIWIKRATYELLPTGECDGNSIETKQEVLVIDGKTKEETLQKTEEFMKEVKDVNRKCKAI